METNCRAAQTAAPNQSVSFKGGLRHLAKLAGIAAALGASCPESVRAEEALLGSVRPRPGHPLREAHVVLQRPSRRTEARIAVGCHAVGPNCDTRGGGRRRLQSRRRRRLRGSGTSVVDREIKVATATSYSDSPHCAAAWRADRFLPMRFGNATAAISRRRRCRPATSSREDIEHGYANSD